jgi:hypothetical protein
LPREEYHWLVGLFRDADAARREGSARAARMAPRGTALAALGAGDDPDPEAPESARAVAAVRVPVFGMDSALVAVRLLGPVRVELHPSAIGTGALVERSQVPLLTEIVVAATLHPEGLHPVVLQSAVWPRGVGDDVVARTVREVQEWLGRDDMGYYRFRPGADGRWRLSQDVVCDWDVFRCLVAGSQGLAEGSSLQEALALARGEVFSGTPVARYGWLAFQRAARDARITATSVALRAAALAAADGREGDAVAALDRGLMLVPASEVLWRELLRLAVLDSRRAAEEVALRMVEELRIRGMRPEPETDALVESLVPGLWHRIA